MLKLSEQLKTELKLKDATKRQLKIVNLGVPSSISNKELFDCMNKIYLKNILV